MATQRKEAGLARRAENAPAKTSAGGYGQMVPMARQVLPGRELVSREATVVLYPDQHFYVTKTYEEGQQKVTHRALLEGKVQIESLAGAWHETAIDETTASREYVRAIGRVYYRTPSGKVECFERDREYDVELEYHKSILKKINSALYKLKNSHSPSYAEIAKMVAESTDSAEALDKMLNKLLPPEELVQLRLAQLEVRTHLRALCRSKAHSQALTDFCRYIGARLSYTSLPSGQIEVKVINTIEIPTNVSQGVSMLFDGDESSDEAETERFVAEVAAEDEERIPMPQEHTVIDEKTVHTGTGEVVDEPAEVFPPEEAEDIPQENMGGPSKEELLAELQSAVTTLGWTPAKLKLFANAKLNKNDLEGLSLDEIANLVTLLQDEVAKKEAK